MKLVSEDNAPVQWSSAVSLSAGTASACYLWRANRGIELRHGPISAARFGEATLKLGGGLTLTGLRVEEGHQTFGRNETMPAPGALDLDATSSAVLPKLAAAQADAAGLLVCQRWGGLQAGRVLRLADVPAYAAFGPERTTAYEAGLTSSTADHSSPHRARFLV